MAKSLIGIDVNCTEISMFNGADGKLYAEALPENIVDDTGIVAPESEIFPNFIAKMKKKGNIKGKQCALILPESTAFYKTFNSPVVSDEQIKLNLPYEFRSFVGSEPQKYGYDYFIDEVVKDEEGNPIELRVVAAAALKQQVEDFGECLKRAGLDLRLALPREVCLINLMKKTANPEKEYCLVGVSYEHTSIYLFAGTKLVATKDVELGARDIDRAIADVYDIDERIASTYRNSNHDNCLNHPSLTDMYNRIALEVMKTINFYRYEHSDSKIDTAYFFDLCAGNAGLNDEICSQIGFTKGNIKDLLPKNYQNLIDAERELYSIGLVLSEA